MNGFVWVNMDAKETPEVPWEEQFEDVDRQDRYRAFNFNNYDLDPLIRVRWQIQLEDFGRQF